MKIFIIKYNRSPIGNFLSSFKNISINNLSKQCLDKLFHNFNKQDINKIYIGNVLSTGLGQNIARQIGYENDIDVPAITVNNVCGSGLLSIIEGYKSILLNESECVLVGGVESMSQSPHYTKLRNNRYGNLELIDSMKNDGLIDSMTNKSMTEIAEELCLKHKITRKDYDNYAKMSYNRARQANELGIFKNEIVPININNKLIIEDEEINKISELNKLDKLNPVYENGISTAGNISKLSDGVSFLILANEEYVIKNKLKPIAEIIDYDLMTCNPELAPICTTLSIQKKNINVDLYEVNEPFPLTIIHLSKELNIPIDKINIYGSAISIGHPLGCSGARIVCTLLTALINEKKNIGCASIGNGGGGATTIYLKNCNNI